MKVAIVGSTCKHATEEEMEEIRKRIAFILKDLHPTLDMVISGGAEGVDSIAEEIAKGFGLPTDIHLPKQKNWTGYKDRNIKIAESCHKLYCITTRWYPNTRRIKCYHHHPPRAHEKTAGCWTMKKALDLNKECDLIVI